MNENRVLFCFGLGYSAKALARRLNVKGWSVRGTCQTIERRAALEALGFCVSKFDGITPIETPEIFKGVTHFLLSIPPKDNLDPALFHHNIEIANQKPLWLGYLSTTGVYGDQNGGWVDENSALKPSNTRSKQRVKVEQDWLNWGQRNDVPVQIFRLAGIYGPKRSVFEKIKDKKAKRIGKPGHLFSRIHVEDIATVLEASISKPEGGKIYNVCDDEPASQSDVISFAYSLMGRSPPPEIPLEKSELSSMALSFWRDNRRVSNARIKQELGIKLAFPSYKDGLNSIFNR